MNAEFEAMSDEELAVVAGLAPAHGGGARGSDIKSDEADQSDFANRYKGENSGYVAFLGVMHWALTLCHETSGHGRFSKAARDRIVEGAWLAYEEMNGADADMPTGWPGCDP